MKKHPKKLVLPLSIYDDKPGVVFYLSGLPYAFW